MADQLDDSGVPVIQRVMQIARSDGEGYYRYNWRRLHDLKDPQIIKTVYGAGYLFAADVDWQEPTKH